jgi:inosose dehydratase
MLQRRHFIKAVAESIAMGTGLTTLGAGNGNPGQIKVAITPNSWGVWFAQDPMQPPWERFLDEAAEAGYRWIELGPEGYLPADVATLRSHLEQRGLQVCATHLRGHLEAASFKLRLEKQAIAAGKLTAELGGRFLIISDDTYYGLFTGPPCYPARLPPDDWKRLIANVHGLADLMAERYRLKLLLHPQFESHLYQREHIEAFLEEIPPDKVSLCFDVGHYALGGGDPIEFFRRHRQRIASLRLKNIDRMIRTEAVDAESMDFARAVGVGVFCELSQGELDLRAFRRVLTETGYSGWAVVDQDMYPVGFDKPLPVAKNNRAYLQALGIG